MKENRREYKNGILARGERITKKERQQTGKKEKYLLHLRV
jgi:hypothetical protein